jgi:pyruvate dehydrogenase E2 component (dihydrolipoamide acetyltransferase)
MRQDLNDSLGEKIVSVNDLIIKACALALRKVPEANASWQNDHIRQYHAADVSMAVAIPNGLITPVIRDADRKSVITIAKEAKELAVRARAGKLKPEEFQGGTFSLSNLGMFGIQHFGAIINPPQGCILAVGAAEQKPIVKDGQLSIGQILCCTLSVDHRVVDGATGAQFLAAFRDIITKPIALMM